jgi:histidine triad (HIT) family protein
MEGCVFCRIINKELPANVVFESDEFIVFHDVKPEAPTHLLVVTKKHIPSLAHALSEDVHLAQLGIRTAMELASTLHLDNYRVSVNSGKKAGQIVDHLHYHLLSW